MDNDITSLDTSIENSVDQEIEYAIPRYGFTINGQQILQDPDLPSEFNIITKIRALPHSPPWFSGLVNQHNNLIPVYDLTKLIESQTTTEKSLRQYLLTMQINSGTVGLLIDGIPRHIVEELKPIQNFSNDWPALISDSITNVYSQEGTNWIELSFHKLFLALANQ